MRRKTTREKATPSRTGQTRPSRTRPADRLDRLDRLAALLQGLQDFSEPADIRLSAYFKSHPGLGGKERGFLAEGAYAAIRQWTAFQTLLTETGIGQDSPSRPRRLALLSAVAAVGFDRLVSELTEGERAWLDQASRMLASTPARLRLSIPDWIWADWLAQLGDSQTAALAARMAQPAPLFLRVNGLKTTADQVMTSLGQAGIRTRQSLLLSECLEVDGKPGLARTESFLAGDFEVQDLGSQILARLAGPRRSAFVVDFCAGAGGKTLALGDLMRNSGRLYALDRSATRLARLKPRLARSGLSNVWPIAISGLKDDRLLRLAGKADLVLVDAPCTGLGTLRRNPDLKWRQTPEGLKELVALQASILDSAARLVKLEGRLVYATCSTSRAENEDQVAAFLARHPGFERISAELECRRLTIDLPEAWQAFTPEGDLRLWPHRTEADGFYGAVLVRRA